MYVCLGSQIPVISAAELPNADGIMLGTPTRFGSVSAQFKSFLDSTGGLWTSVRATHTPLPSPFSYTRS